MSSHFEAGAMWRAEAEQMLAPLSQQLAVAPGHKPAYSELLVVDWNRVRRAMQCQAQPAVDEEDYFETAARARRRVGLAVLATMRERPEVDPMSAFDEALSDRARFFSDALSAWIEQLGRGGRAILAQQAVGYASGVAAFVSPSRLASVAVCGPGEWFSWSVPGRAVRIRGRCEALSPRGARPADRRLLLVSGGLDQARALAGHAALAYTLTLGSVPARATVLAPAQGSEVVTIDDDLLGSALGSVAAAVHAGLAARFGPAAPTTAGAWCRGCRRLDECEDGAGFVDAHPLRIGGLLPIEPVG